ncbi:TlpA family protein disulfide reductase [Bartonella sp. B41]
MILKIFTRRENNNKKIQFCISSLIIALILCTMDNNRNRKEAFFFDFISQAKAQETNINEIRSKKITAIQKAAKGFFTYLRFTDTPYNMNHLSFKDAQDKDLKIGDFNGRPVLVNLWAIWCAPCRAEMPELAQLKREMGGDAFDVIAINTDGTDSHEKIQQFLHKAHASNLVYYNNKTMDIFREMKKQRIAAGLPITLLIDKNGDLIAFLNGAAPWANEDAKALIKAFIEETSAN